MNMCVQL